MQFAEKMYMCHLQLKFMQSSDLYQIIHIN